MARTGYTYILASKRNGTLYTGVTNNLVRRLWEHRFGNGPSFTKRYGIFMLVLYEVHHDMLSAIAREKEIKKLLRHEKITLIEENNPQWCDMTQEVSQW